MASPHSSIAINALRTTGRAGLEAAESKQPRRPGDQQIVEHRRLAADPAKQRQHHQIGERGEQRSSAADEQAGDAVDHQGGGRREHGRDELHRDDRATADRGDARVEQEQPDRLAIPDVDVRPLGRGAPRRRRGGRIGRRGSPPDCRRSAGAVSRATVAIASRTAKAEAGERSAARLTQPDRSALGPCQPRTRDVIPHRADHRAGDPGDPPAVILFVDQTADADIGNGAQ